MTNLEDIKIKNPIRGVRSNSILHSSDTFNHCFALHSENGIDERITMDEIEAIVKSLNKDRIYRVGAIVTIDEGTFMITMIDDYHYEIPVYYWRKIVK